MWKADGSLQCDTCDQVLDRPGPRVVVVDAARARGWHIFQGESLTGKDLDSALCPRCVGSNRAARSKPDTFEEEVPLF